MLDRSQTSKNPTADLNGYRLFQRKKKSFYVWFIFMLSTVVLLASSVVSLTCTAGKAIQLLKILKHEPI